MLKQLMLSKQLVQAREELGLLNESDADIKVRSKALRDAIDEAETKEETEEVTKSVESLEKEKEELKEEKSKVQDKIEEIEKELKELENKEPENTNSKDDDMKGRANADLEVREGITNYIRSKGQSREGFKLVDGGALVPEALLTPEKIEEDILDLTKYVRTIKVNTGSGKYPVIKKSDGRMISVAELAENPELAKPSITDVPFNVETYRGYIAVSQEVIDDATFDITGLIAEDINDQELNTKNLAILEMLKLATPQTAQGFDGLKDIFNVKLKKSYNPMIIASASMFNALDKVKDNSGKYILQDDVTAKSGKKLFGRYDIEVVDDEVIGESENDMVAYIGDAKEQVTLFDRKKTSVKWVDNNIYGELLAGYTRFGVSETDEDAGFYVTYTDAPTV